MFLFAGGIWVLEQQAPKNLKIKVAGFDHLFFCKEESTCTYMNGIHLRNVSAFGASGFPL